MYIIVSFPKYKTEEVNFLYLVDRNKTRKRWWTRNIDDAIKFESYDKALEVISKYKYRYPWLIEI